MTASPRAAAPRRRSGMSPSHASGPRRAGCATPPATPSCAPPTAASSRSTAPRGPPRTSTSPTRCDQRRASTLARARTAAARPAQPPKARVGAASTCRPTTLRVPSIDVTLFSVLRRKRTPTQTRRQRPPRQRFASPAREHGMLQRSPIHGGTEGPRDDSILSASYGNAWCPQAFQVGDERVQFAQKWGGPVNSGPDRVWRATTGPPTLIGAGISGVRRSTSSRKAARGSTGPSPMSLPLIETSKLRRVHDAEARVT